MLNAMTVDVEDWYMTSGLNVPPEQWDRFEDRVVANTERVLDLLARTGTKATFFVLGCVAERHPRLIERIAADGHELGTHGYNHRLLTTMHPEEIVNEILSTKKLIEQISGHSVKMFRAPSWSLTPSMYGVLSALDREGFSCDSSMQPFRTPLSGIVDAPVAPFHPVVGGKRLSLVEFPSTVVELFGMRLPFAGGLYLRALPYPFIRAALRRVNRTRPGMVYIHPWELDPDHPRMKVPPNIRFAQYYRLESCAEKLERLLREFSFGTIGTVIGENSFPDIALKEAQTAEARGKVGGG